MEKCNDLKFVIQLLRDFLDCFRTRRVDVAVVSQWDVESTSPSNQHQMTVNESLRRNTCFSECRKGTLRNGSGRI